MNNFQNYEEYRRWWSASGMALWGSAIQTVFLFLGLSLLMYFVYNATDIFLSGIVPSLASMSMDYYKDRFSAFFGGAVICFLIAFLGYVVYLIGICRFRGVQRTQESGRHARNIMLAELTIPVLIILFFVVFFSNDKVIFMLAYWPKTTLAVMTAIFLATVIIPLVEFKALSKEAAWSETAHKGASDLCISYSCTLWGISAVIVGAILIACLIYSTLNNLQSLSYGYYGDSFDRINSFTQEAYNLAGAVRVVLLFVSLAVLICALMHSVYKIKGWNKIKHGYLETSEETATNDHGYCCHQCGARVPDGASFCPGCGTAVATMPETAPEAEKAEEQQEENIYHEEDYDEDNKKKWLKWGGTAVGIIAIAAGIWALSGGFAKTVADSKVFVNSSPVYESIENGSGTISLALLDYGTPVQKLAGAGKDDIWTEIMFEQNGKTIKGFLNKHDIMTLDDFDILDEAGFDDVDVREQITERMYRLAIARAIKSLDGKWKLEISDDTDQYANARYVPIRGASPSESCFVFALVNEEDADKRKAFVYSTPDIFEEGSFENPVYLYNEDIPIDKSSIIDVTYDKKKKKYSVSYLIAYGYCGEDEDDDNIYEEEESTTSYCGPIELKGQIGGKYDITMTLYVHDDQSITGHYEYTKYKTPIQLTGRYRTYNDGMQDFVIYESADGEILGSFTGRFTGDSFSGNWKNTDGTKEMPFELDK